MDVNFSRLETVKRYDAEIVEIKHSSKASPLHTFIRFWGRLPDYLLDDLFNRFKNKKILFDPFGGSGFVIFKGMKNNFSKIIYNDLNPTFTFITKTIYDSLNISRSELEKNVGKLKEELLSSPIILDLLKVRKSFFIHKFAYRQIIILKKNQRDAHLGFQKQILNDISSKIIRTLKCKKVMEFSELREKTITHLKNYNKLKARSIFSLVLNKLVEKGVIEKKTERDYLVLSLSATFPKHIKILKIDKNLNKKLEEKEKKYGYLINRKVFSYSLNYPNGNRLKKAGNAKVIGDLYTTWSKILLSIIWEKINRFPARNKNMINVLKLCFLASLYDSSKMQMPHKSGWVIQSFWIPPTYGTKNPLYVFIKKLNHFLSVHDWLKKEFNDQIEIQIYNKDILEFNRKMLKDKPDLVITHPPYFSTIQYGELSTLWAPWLNYQIPFEKEIVENCQQGKNKDKYLLLLENSLEKISHLSEKNADIVLIFQSRNQKDWELLDKVFLKLPLELKQIRCYKRSSWWGSKHLFNIGNYDYALIFKNHR